MAAMWESLFIAGVLLCLGRGVGGQGGTALLLGEIYSVTLQPGIPQTFVYELSPPPSAIEQVLRLDVDFKNSCQRFYTDFRMHVILVFHFKSFKKNY